MNTRFRLPSPTSPTPPPAGSPPSRAAYRRQAGEISGQGWSRRARGIPAVSRSPRVDLTPAIAHRRGGPQLWQILGAAGKPRRGIVPSEPWPPCCSQRGCSRRCFVDAGRSIQRRPEGRSRFGAGRKTRSRPCLTCARRSISRKLRAVPTSPATAVDLNNLAEATRLAARYDDAEQLYRRAIAIDERAAGDKIGLATSLNNLALVYRAQKRLDEAEPLYLRSLSLLEQALGPTDPDVGQVPEQSGHAVPEPRRAREGAPAAAACRDDRREEPGRPPCDDLDAAAEPGFDRRGR